MNGRKLSLIGFVMVCILALGTQGFSQAQTTQNRIPQQIVIGGQQANGTYVTAPTGGMQSFTCSNPQPYVTPDGASQGWACYDQTTGTWLLNAVPPRAAQEAPAPVQVAPPQPTVIYQQPPTIIYQQPAPTIVYAAPGYAAYPWPGYAVYPGYPVVVARGYSPSVVLGTAAIRAAGRIASAAVIGHRYSYRPRYGSPQRHFRR